MGHKALAPHLFAFVIFSVEIFSFQCFAVNVILNIGYEKYFTYLKQLQKLMWIFNLLERITRMKRQF